MFPALSPFIGITLLLLAGGYIPLARYFFLLLADERRKNQELLNRLLIRGNVEPIIVEREQVVKLPDPEAGPARRTWVDEAYRLDEIKEMLEEAHPDAAEMTAEEAMHAYQRDWAHLERLWDEQHTPLRTA